MASITTVLLLGKPASGKGTQAKLLASERGWRYVATGDHLRSLAQREDDFGARIREELATGKLLPTPLMTHLLIETLIGLPPEEGIVLDGFARTVSQAIEFNDLMTWFGRRYRAVHIDVSDATATERMLIRSADGQRSDSDTPEKVRRRLEIYAEQWLHLEPRLRAWNVLRDVDGELPLERVHTDICALLL